MPELSNEQKAEIIDLLKSGGKIAAIKRHRELTGSGLKNAKEAVEALAVAEGVEIPEASGCGTTAALFLAGSLVAYLLVR